MEFGPRALGNRSILGDPRDQNMQRDMNIKIKFRESFRPFAPIIKEDKLSEWYKTETISPYMLFVSKLKRNKYVEDINKKFDNALKSLMLKDQSNPSCYSR